MTRTCGKGRIGAFLVMVALGTCAGIAATGRSALAGEAYTKSVMIGRQAGDVWAALVTKSIVDGYYFVPLSADVTATGQQIYYGTRDQQLISGEVLELQPPDVFRHSFKFAGEAKAISIVTYSLAAKGAATRLTVTHEGYDRDSQSYADIAGGWPIILDGIKAKLEGK